MTRNLTLALKIAALALAVAIGGCKSTTSPEPATTPTWSAATTGTSSAILGVCFPTPTIAYACGMNGTILKSVDGGGTWQAQSSGTSEHLYKISFKDANNGFAGGNNMTLLKTNDGGATWSRVTGVSTFGAHIRNLHYDASGHLVMSGNSFAVVSPDGGLTWNTMMGTTGTLYGIASLHDANNNSYAVVGVGGLALRTADAGATWQSSIAFNSGSMSVDFADANHGWAADFGGTLSKSDNGGVSWTELSTSYTNHGGDLRAVKMVSATEIWAAGDNGVVVHSTDGGVSWNTMLIDGLTIQWNDIVQRDAHTLAFVGANGTLYWRTW
jgi:photosystem II stability/assembly factor-like uncharacterized protein